MRYLSSNGFPSNNNSVLHALVCNKIFKVQSGDWIHAIWWAQGHMISNKHLQSARAGWIAVSSDLDHYWAHLHTLYYTFIAKCDKKLCCSLFTVNLHYDMQGLQAASEGNYLTAVENSHQANFCNKMAFAMAVFLQIALFAGFITFIILYAIKMCFCEDGEESCRCYY